MTVAARRPVARPRVLVLSAFAPELAELRRLLAGVGVPAAVRGRVVCQPAGIGLIDAALGASRALADVRPAEILFVGTAGSYAARPAIGEVAVARQLHLVSAAEVRGEAYLPPPLIRRAPTDAGVRRALLRVAAAQASGRAGAVDVDVATPVAITTAPALARAHTRASGSAVENLEAFGIARAAAEAKIPFGAVLGISNRVGPRAHEQWRRHQHEAMRAVATTVFAYLRERLTAPSR